MEELRLALSELGLILSPKEAKAEFPSLSSSF